MDIQHTIGQMIRTYAADAQKRNVSMAALAAQRGRIEGMLYCAGLMSDPNGSFTALSDSQCRELARRLHLADSVAPHKPLVGIV
jgi:hypothetical protein